MTTRKKTQVKAKPPKKMTSVQREERARKDSDAIQEKPTTKKRPLVKPVAAELTKPRVFFDRNRHLFLLLREGPRHNEYLTTRDEELRIIKLEHGSPPRNTNGFLPEDTTHVGDLVLLESSDQDVVAAAQKLYDYPYLTKTPGAMQELCRLLGKPIPEISETVKQARQAATTRLRAVRPPQLPKPGDDTVITLQPKADESNAPSTRAKLVLELLHQAKGHTQTVGQLSEGVGKPVGAAVAKLLALGLVQVKG